MDNSLDDGSKINADVVDMCIEIAPFDSNDFGEYTSHHILTETITLSFDINIKINIDNM